MRFVKTATRNPKGLRTPEILEVPDKKERLSSGTFEFADPNTLLLTLKTGEVVALVIQKASSYTVERTLTDALAAHVPLPSDNESETPATPPNPGAGASTSTPA